MTNRRRLILFHLPLIVVVLIAGALSLIDAGFISSFRNESTFGWMLVVWIPLGTLLGLVQIAIWVWLIVKRGVANGTVPLRTRWLVIVVTAMVIGLWFLRMARVWGIFE